MGLRLHETDTLWVDLLAPGSAPIPMEAFLSIRTHFAAAHRLARPELSQGENETIYGKCARPPWPRPQLPARRNRPRPDRCPHRHGL